MNVLVSSSFRCILTPDGQLWTANHSSGYSFWCRYLDVYEQVHLLVRAKMASEPPANWARVSGPGIVPVPFTYYRGMLGFVKSAPAIWQSLRLALRGAEAIAIRAPCLIGSMLGQMLQAGRPYSVEVVGDPYEVFAPAVSNHPLRPVLRWTGTQAMKRLCRRAAATAYVNSTVLPRRYPCAEASFVSHFSSVDLEDEAFEACPHVYGLKHGPLVLVMVGTMDQLYKGHETAIDAIAECVRNGGLRPQLVMIGDGRYRQRFERRAARNEISEHVVFRGSLSSVEAVRGELDRADIFLLPSLTEGLPRAMIEAMARALPCIGSTAGGIPELLPAEDMVPPGDVRALVGLIREVASAPLRMTAMSKRNLAKAREYHVDVLRARRTQFYQFLRDRTEMWLAGQ